MGSMGPSGMSGASSEQVYNVPWRVRVPELPPVTTGLVLYWFPSSVEEVKRSSLRTSRVLSLYAAQCVSMEIVDAVRDGFAQFLIDEIIDFDCFGLPLGPPFPAAVFVSSHQLLFLT